MGLFLNSSSFATQSSTWGNLPPIKTCIQKYIKNAQRVNFSNWYHEGISRMARARNAREAKLSICSMYMMGGNTEHLTLGTMIPVYQIDSDRAIGFYSIYLWQDYSMSGFWDEKYYTWAFFWWTIRSNGSWSMYDIWWFQGWKFGENGGLFQSNNQAYLKSLEEPFRSAPTIQMYSYVGSPLLVARSQTGLVTDIFFQSRDVTDTINLAKKYLWDKWYHP